MKNILIFVKSENDDFVPFWGFFHFFPKWKGRKYFFYTENPPVFNRDYYHT